MNYYCSWCHTVIKPTYINFWSIINSLTLFVLVKSNINFPAGNLGTVKSEGSSTTESVKEEKCDLSDVDMSSEPEVTPVGQEYIEEITNDDGKSLLLILLAQVSKSDFPG